MKLVVLGANGYRPSDLGHTACCAIPELGITLDAGTGFYRMADYLETAGLDVFLSHDHRDHTWGLGYVEFMFSRRMVRDAVARDGKATLAPIYESLHDSSPRVRIHGAEEHLRQVQRLVVPTYSTSIEYVPLQPTVHLPDGALLHSFPVEHWGDKQCFGFRLDGPGRSLAYVTDTYGEPGASYLEQIRGVDVLLHECYMPDDEPEMARRIGHSHVTPVCQLAADAGVGRLILIHLNPLRPEAGEPELERAQTIFPRTEVAYDRMEIGF